MAFEKHTEEYQGRRKKALGMGGPEKIAQRKSEGVLNARERLDHLMDKDSFLELGLFATSPRPETRERTPADGKVSGFGKIDGRPVAVVANDFTVMGASSTQVNGRKINHLKQLATRRGTPMIFLGESTGARMPDIMGATGIGAGDRPTQFLRMRETPWVSAVLGSAFGSTAWYAAMSDFVVMRKGSVMAVSSPRLASMATGEIIDGESLGGWRLHTEKSGLVDLAVDTDAKALDAIKRFLSYLPSHHNERPPAAEVPAGCDEPIKHVFEVFPDSATKAYDVRRIIERIFDIGSVFELKARYGKPITTALARLNGRTIGVLANNPLYKGGAIDIDGCIKATGFIVLCDSFNIPLVFLVDQPGFLIGIEGEMRGAPGRVINWMNALALITVPKVSIILRKSYGQSMVNMGGAGNSDTLACWFTGEVSFMDPRFGVRIVHGVEPEDDPERFQALLTEMSKDTSAYSMASNYSAHAVIDPRDTREYLMRTLEFDQLRLSAGIGDHLMRTWPTSIVCGGHVAMYFSGMLAAMPHVKAGKLRALAVSTAKRSPAAPDVPGVAESGMRDFDISTWYGVLVPAATPKDIIGKLNAEFFRVLTLPEVTKQLAREGAETAPDSPEQFGRFIQSEIAKFARIIKESGARSE